MKVLIVISDLLLNQELSSLLIQLDNNTQIICTSDGLSALDLVLNYFPDIIILNENTSSLSGTQTIHALRLMPITKNAYFSNKRQ